MKLPTTRRPGLLAATAALALIAVTGCGGDDAGTERADDPASEPAGTPSDRASATPMGDTDPTATPEAGEPDLLALAYPSGDLAWAETVTYLIGGETVGELEADSLPDAFRDCPEGATEHEGRECPVSPIDTLALLREEGAEPVRESGVPRDVGCNRNEPPADQEDWDAVTLRPPTDRRSCFEDFAVTLFADPSGQVQMVQFVLSGP